jgi:hypothetical protein
MFLIHSLLPRSIYGRDFNSVRMNFAGLHGVISQKIELFITTVMRTSNPMM